MHFSKENLTLGTFIILGLVAALACWTVGIHLLVCVQGCMLIGFVTVGVMHRKHPIDEYKQAMGVTMVSVWCMWLVQLITFGVLDYTFQH